MRTIGLRSKVLALAILLATPACWLPYKLSASCREQLDRCLQGCQPPTSVDQSVTPWPSGVSRDTTTPCERSCYALAQGCK